MLAQIKIAPVKSAILIIYGWFNHLIINNLFSDAAYIAAWMIDYCNLIGRKVVFEPPRLVFKAVLHSFPNESELWGSIASSMKFTCFLSVTKVQNLGMFSSIMSTKCKIFSRILYADQKRNIQLKPFFFSSPLFDLTLLPVYIITVIKVKLRVELYLFWGKQKFCYWKFSNNWKC